MKIGITDMAFIYKQGNLLKEKAEALVNTVNTVGVMGKGIALQFKEKFPLNYKLYRQAWKNKELQTGKMFVTSTKQQVAPLYIINFPTKEHWRNKSKIDYVEKGLDDLAKVVKEKKIKSIAIPPLGCGNGGLNWTVVRSLIEQKLKSIAEQVEVIIFEPSLKAAAPTRERKNKTKPKLTPLRAMLLASMFQYKTLCYDISVLEVQKLVYLLQRLGNNFNLKFVKHHYGPYSNQLRYVLNDLDGFYLNGMQYNSAKPFDKLSLEDKYQEVIQDFIAKKCTANQRESLNTLYQLIDGFESPLGMELLATVDFLVIDQKIEIQNIDDLQKAITEWNNRKVQLMRRPYLEETVKRLTRFEKELFAEQ